MASGGEHNATVLSIGKLRTLVIFVIVLAILCTALAITCEPWWAAHLPWFVMHVLVNVKKPLGDILMGASMALIWCLWSAAVFFVLTLGSVSMRWAVLCPVATIWIVLVRKDPARMTYPGGALLMALFWDPPLMINVFLVDYLFGATYLHDGEGGYHSEIDENIIVASMPTPRRVAELSRLGVKAVVNMCAEYGGPVSAYRRAGIEQLHLPTLDATCPTVETLTRAVHFITSKVAQDPSSKVLIHCKGGRGRAATTCMAYLVAKNRRPLLETFSLLRDARNVVEPVILAYHPLKAFCRQFIDIPDKIRPDKAFSSSSSSTNSFSRSASMSES